jgi:hypothetical protein
MNPTVCGFAAGLQALAQRARIHLHQIYKGSIACPTLDIHAFTASTHYTHIFNIHKSSSRPA